MTNLILVTFGTPEHDWLPVDFHYNDFSLDFDASAVLNDPIEELYNLSANPTKKHIGLFLLTKIKSKISNFLNQIEKTYQLLLDIQFKQFNFFNL